MPRINTIPLIALVAALLLVSDGGARLKLAFEDRADPNPRQFALGAQVFGLALALAISWSDRDNLPVTR